MVLESSEFPLVARYAVVAVSPKRISLCKHSDFSEPKNRSRCAFKFGARGGRRTGSTFVASNDRNDSENFESRSIL